ncbi:DUF3263 domain-containing protein [Micromonospora sp. R77]|uniref:DUF3263 domain-containing protein n=1 Tax=Micromonospora sp. R77 TaxID=2925836 RepID=UPI001F616A2D|nr:DUF3263 domain-containing protein [Micromonospora sp. R77]MCI4063029.1 DUF3263 domain-containing protein [Micromonospora sp. R77]
MPADAATAADRPEPSGRVDVGRREGTTVVPPPRSAPEAGPTPVVEADPVRTVEADPADGSTYPDDLTGADAAPDDTDAAPDGSDARPDGAGAAPDGPADRLTERERRILAFEQQWWKHAGAKEQAIRDTFGLSATRYYQLLNGLLDQPAALAAEPVLIGRLRRLRSSRARNRRR